MVGVIALVVGAAGLFAAGVWVGVLWGAKYRITRDQVVELVRSSYEVGALGVPLETIMERIMELWGPQVRGCGRN